MFFPNTNVRGVAESNAQQLLITCKIDWSNEANVTQKCILFATETAFDSQKECNIEKLISEVKIQGEKYKFLKFAYYIVTTIKKEDNLGIALLCRLIGRDEYMRVCGMHTLYNYTMIK